MAINLDGTDFAGLDSDLFGDGSDDDNSRFLSTYQERRIDANARYLWENGWRIGYAPVMKASTSTGKPHLSVEPTTYMHVPIWLDPTDTSIKVRFLAQVDDNASTGNAEMTCKLQVGPLESETAFGESDNIVHEVSLEDLEIATPGFYPMALWLSSTGDLQEVDSGNGTSTGATFDFFDSTIDVGSGSLDLSAHVDDSTIIEMGSAAISVTPLHQQSGTKQVPVDFGDNPYPGDSVTYIAYDASYIRILGMEIQVERDADRTGSQYWSLKDEAECFALEPVLGQHTGKHGVNADGIYQAPRCVMVGPKGTRNPESSWPADYHSRWTWVWGDTGGTLLDEVAKLDREASELKVNGYFGAAHLVSVFRTSRLETLQDDAAVGSWDITASVEQIGAGETWASGSIELASETQTIDIDHYPTTKNSTWPLLQQLWWAYFSDGSGKANELNTYVWREGQLWERDLALLEPFAFSLDLSDVDLDGFVRIQITASLNSATYDATTGTSAERADERLILLNTGTTAWEFGAL